jgi:hypothetical protein
MPDAAPSSSSATAPMLVLVMPIEGAAQLFEFGTVGDQAVERVAAWLAFSSPTRLRLLAAIVDVVREGGR